MNIYMKSLDDGGCIYINLPYYETNDKSKLPTGDYNYIKYDTIEVDGIVSERLEGWVERVTRRSMWELLATTPEADEDAAWRWHPEPGCLDCTFDFGCWSRFDDHCIKAKHTKMEEIEKL